MTAPTEQDARQMIAVVNSRNVDKIVELYAEDATFQVPNLEAPLHGKTAIRGFHAGSFAAFPDWTMDVSRVYVTGNDIVIVNSVRGTHSGPLAQPNGQSIAPTNRKFVEDQMTRIVLNANGKVESLRSYGNPAELTHQLGLPK